MVSKNQVLFTDMEVIYNGIGQSRAFPNGVYNDTTTRKTVQNFL